MAAERYSRPRTFYWERFLPLGVIGPSQGSRPLTGMKKRARNTTYWIGHCLHV